MTGLANAAANLVKVTVSGTPGTGAITLSTAVAPFFDAGELTNGKTYAYSWIDGANCGSGYGVYTSSGTSLARDAAERCNVAGTPQSTPAAMTSAAIVSFSGILKNEIARLFTVPVITTHLSSSGTYTPATDANGNLPLYVKIRLQGGGAGGAGSGTTPGKGGAGGNTTFGTSFLTAPGAAQQASVTTGGPGGVIATGGNLINLPGVAGADSQSGFTNSQGSPGGAGPLGGAAFPADTTGPSAVANTGAGGAGAGSSGTASPGAGGGSGAYLEHILVNPTGTYAWAVGAGGTAGTTGTSGHAGGAGAAGQVIIEEYWS